MLHSELMPAFSLHRADRASAWCATSHGHVSGDRSLQRRRCSGTTPVNRESGPKDQLYTYRDETIPVTNF